MGAILGTVPGWQRAPGWTSSNRVYTGPGFLRFEVPPVRIPPERRFEYRTVLNITTFLCDSPDLINPLVIRRINGIRIINIFTEEYPGGLEQWVSDVSIREAEELSTRSIIEVAGLVPCERAYGIDEVSSEFIPPIVIPPIPPPVPKFVLDILELLEQRLREAETVDEKIAIQEEINSLRRRFGL